MTCELSSFCDMEGALFVVVLFEDIMDVVIFYSHPV